MFNFSKITSYLTIILAICTIAVTIYTSKYQVKTYIPAFFLIATIVSYLISRNLISKEFFSKDEKTKEVLEEIKKNKK